ncbi:DUF1963 domain-containing protein [Methylopila musalis]|uniref:DUF1963 domain-containing protein n=1 Tax=Methylopila musalis TaxID=1134781 RepID=A0ABW3Z999_9HYPH
MTAFRTEDDLRRSLAAGGLSGPADAIVASARPVLLFLRRQTPDDPLPPGASKMGGFPDLPKGFDWPERPPYPDAERKAAAVLAFARTTEAEWRARAERPLKPHERRIPTEEIDRLVPTAIERGLTFGSYFPLAFMAQLDLAALSREPGFDPDLPRSGLLSVFEDATAEGLPGGPVAFWSDGPASALRRAPPSSSLTGFFDRCSNHGFGASEPWSRLTMAERLEPHSALAVPHHWKYAFPPESSGWRAIWDWFQSAENGVFTPQGDDGPPPSGHFGDRLGGWPDDIQGNPEVTLDGQQGRPTVTPGRTPWRHLFSYGGEFYAGTRLMGSDGKGDGTTYLMIDRQDLAARRFDRTRWVYDQT